MSRATPFAPASERGEKHLLRLLEDNLERASHYSLALARSRASQKRFDPYDTHGMTPWGAINEQIVELRDSVRRLKAGNFGQDCVCCKIKRGYVKRGTRYYKKVKKSEATRPRKR